MNMRPLERDMMVMDAAVFAESLDQINWTRHNSFLFFARVSLWFLREEFNHFCFGQLFISRLNDLMNSSNEYSGAGNFYE